MAITNPEKGALPEYPPRRSGTWWSRVLFGGIAAGILALLIGALRYVSVEPAEEPGPASGAADISPPDSSSGSGTPDGSATDAQDGSEPSRVLEPQPQVAEFRALILGLETELGALRERLAKQTRLRRELRVRLDALEKAQRLAAERPAAAALPAPGSDSRAELSLERLTARMYRLEKVLESEGTARLEFQSSLLKRIDNLERSRDRMGAESLEARRALQERLYNLEVRIQRNEQTQVESERKLMERIRSFDGR